MGEAATAAVAAVAPCPVRPFVPTADSLERLWKRFDAARAVFTDELPSDPIRFVTWIATETTKVFDVGPSDNPIGAFIFADVSPGEAAFAHVFIWDRDRYPPAALVEAARATCKAMFTVFNLRRINGLTPTTHVHARVFAERVGFVVEGTLRDAVVLHGRAEKAWISGLLPTDLGLPPWTPSSAPTGTLVEGGST